jgi:hypothetical protein
LSVDRCIAKFVMLGRKTESAAGVIFARRRSSREDA